MEVDAEETSPSKKSDADLKSSRGSIVDTSALKPDLLDLDDDEAAEEDKEEDKKKQPSSPPPVFSGEVVPSKMEEFATAATAAYSKAFLWN